MRSPVDLNMVRRGRQAAILIAAAISWFLLPYASNASHFVNAESDSHHGLKLQSNTNPSNSALRRHSRKKYDNDGWVMSTGLGSPNALNLIGISKEIKNYNNHVRLFGSGGLGFTVIGIGISYSSNNDGTGIVGSATIGAPAIHAAAGYRMPLPKNGYFSWGVIYATLWGNYSTWFPIVAFEFPVNLGGFLFPSS